MKTRVQSAILLAFALFGSSCVSLDGFFFNPRPLPEAAPYALDDYGPAWPATPRVDVMSTEQLTLTADDGSHIYGVMARQPNSEQRATVLYHHGNASNVSGYWHRVAILYGLGVNVLIYDYPGYGRTPGTPSEPGIYRAARTALAYLNSAEARIDRNRIFHYGYSLGGAPATELASTTVNAGLILEATFTSVQGLTADGSLLLPSSFLMTNRFDNKSKIRRAALASQRGILFLHGTADDFVQPRYSQEMYDLVRREPPAGPATLVLIDGANHGEVACSNHDGQRCLPAQQGSMYLDKLREFLESSPARR
jgi:fermentation-respiration switch protein FrsA (DUF1100 family)